LAQAEELLQRDQELAVEEPALAKLVQHSRRQRRARERLRRILLGGALIVALLLAVVAWFAWVQRNEAITAKDVAQNRPFFGEIAAAVLRLEKPYVRNLDNPRKFDETSEFEVHDRGEIWSGAFWELRSLLGRELADRLLAQAWKSTAWPIAEQDTTRSFIDALLLSARKIASDQQVAQIMTALRTRRFPLPG
jgi:hypothetical protein